MSLDVANTIPPSDILHPIKCGHRNEDVLDADSKDYSFRVVSGAVAKKGEYPWQVTTKIMYKMTSAV